MPDPGSGELRVAELWRYPVKSLRGERLESCAIDRDGLRGDRDWALFDLETGYGLTARRVPELLFAAARLREGAAPEITAPDGSVLDSDEALSDWLGRRVALCSAADREVAGDRRYENPVDAERETGAWQPFTGAPGPFHDSAGNRVSMVSRGSTGEWDRRRFRANIVLDGSGEDELVGRDAALGSVQLHIGQRIPRCVMVTRPQPGGIDRDLSVLRTLARERDSRIAVGATVLVPGEVASGDRLRRCD